MAESRKTTTLTISLPNDLAAAVRRVAGRRGVSEFMTEAAKHRLHLQGLAEIVADGEARSGPLTEDDRARARWEFQHAWDPPVATAA